MTWEKVEFPAGTEPPMDRIREMCEKSSRATIERELLIIMVEESIFWSWKKHGYITEKEWEKAIEKIRAQNEDGFRAWSEYYGYELLDHAIVGDYSLPSWEDGNHTLNEYLMECQEVVELIKKQHLSMDSEIGCIYIYGTKEGTEVCARELNKILNIRKGKNKITPCSRGKDVGYIPVIACNNWETAEKGLRRFGIEKESLKPWLLQKYGIGRKYFRL